MNTNEDYVAFTQKLSYIINSETQEKTIVISASRILRDLWVTKGLITLTRELNKPYKKELGKNKPNPHSVKFYQYRCIYT